MAGLPSPGSVRCSGYCGRTHDDPACPSYEGAVSPGSARPEVWLEAPGSFLAVQKGCKCPVIDNGHGRGYMGGVTDKDGEVVFVISGNCPLHGQGLDDG